MKCVVGSRHRGAHSVVDDLDPHGVGVAVRLELVPELGGERRLHRGAGRAFPAVRYEEFEIQATVVARVDRIGPVALAEELRYRLVALRPVFRIHALGVVGVGLVRALRPGDDIAEERRRELVPVHDAVFVDLGVVATRVDRVRVRDDVAALHAVVHPVGRRVQGAFAAPAGGHRQAVGRVHGDDDTAFRLAVALVAELADVVGLPAWVFVVVVDSHISDVRGIGLGAFRS